MSSVSHGHSSFFECGRLKIVDMNVYMYIFMYIYFPIKELYQIKPALQDRHIQTNEGY